MADPITTILAKQSASRLREMRDAAQAQIEDLQVQLRWIDRALWEKGASSKSAAPTTVSQPENGNGRSAGRKRGTIRGGTKQLLSDHADRYWSPREIQDALVERGIESNQDAIRVALRRMRGNGEVERDERGWRIAQTDGSTRKPLSAAQELTPAGPGLPTRQPEPAS